jgi:hypothetical protein
MEAEWDMFEALDDAEVLWCGLGRHRSKNPRGLHPIGRCTTGQRCRDQLFRVTIATAPGFCDGLDAFFLGFSAFGLRTSRFDLFLGWAVRQAVRAEDRLFAGAISWLDARWRHGRLQASAI